MGNFPKGSEWRKWDLQVQTRLDLNYSCLGTNSLSPEQLKKITEVTGLKESEITSNEKELNAEQYSKLFISYLDLFTDISVLAITDHNRGDELDYLISASKLAERALTILPGVEISSSHGIHILGVFDPNRKWKNTWSECIDHFMTEIGLIRNRFNSAGQPLNSPLTSQEILEILKKRNGLGIFAHIGTDNGLFKHSNTASGGSAHIDIYVHPLCNIVQLPKTASVRIGVENIINGLEPQYGNKRVTQIKCSDARKITEIGSSFSWIKADPTFDGLKHIVIEPDDRVYLGVRPPKLKLVQENKTKYIKFITINKKIESEQEALWFENINLEINHDLVAIIGNKGSGKSALADIIGLLGKTPNYKHFTFLNAQKFRKRETRLAEHFEANLIWESEDRDIVQSLDEDPNPYDQEKIKYIPQQYFETVCNEENKRGKETESDREILQFENELKKVIFSHVSEAKRLGKESLDELIAVKTEAVEEKIEQLRSELNEINLEVITLESKATPDYLRSIESKLQTRRNDLESHLKNAPTPIVAPSESKENEGKINQQIEGLRKHCEQLARTRDEKINQKNSLNITIEASGRLLAKLKNFDDYIKGLDRDLNDDLKILTLTFNEIITYEIKQGLISEIRAEKEKTLKTLEAEIQDFDEFDTVVPDSFEDKIQKYQKEIELLQNQLSEPGKKYQEYKKGLEEWQVKRKEIEGDTSKIDSVKYFEFQLDYLNNQLSGELIELRNKRRQKSSEIYDRLEEKIAIYRTLYKPVEDFIAANPLKNNSKELGFTASIKDAGLLKFFFEFVNQASKGSFQGEGYSAFVPLVEEVKFENKIDVLHFLDKLILHLESDYRENVLPEDKKRIILNQIKPTKRSQLIDFYNDLFSLKYLKPTFSLELDGKNISQLSPGEKGALLLIFYLLVDQNDIPLVIDQPEENLDNEFVYQMLVPAIKEAKNRRQIIIVTHNPNLAVVCNAEQIIRASIDKTNKNQVTYKSGAIEDQEINQDVINVLEGTMPAFRNRDSKYPEGMSPDPQTDSVAVINSVGKES